MQDCACAATCAHAAVTTAVVSYRECRRSIPPWSRYTRDYLCRASPHSNNHKWFFGCLQQTFLRLAAAPAPSPWPAVAAVANRLDLHPMDSGMTGKGTESAH